MVGIRIHYDNKGLHAAVGAGVVVCGSVFEAQFTSDDVGVQKISGGSGELLRVYYFLYSRYDCGKIILRFPVRPCAPVNIEEQAKATYSHSPHFWDFDQRGTTLKLYGL
jgi:hypothetical protein